MNSECNIEIESDQQPYNQDRLVKYFSWAHTIIVFMPIVASVAFILALSEWGTDWLQSSAGGLLEFLDKLAAKIPIASKPAAWLIERGRAERAEFIGVATAFCWMSAVLGSLLFLFMAFLKRFYIRRFYGVLWPEEVRQNSRQNVTPSRDVTWLFFLFFLYFFIVSYYGNFDFRNLSRFKNNVHLMNLDLYLLPVKLWVMSVCAYVLAANALLKVNRKDKSSSGCKTIQGKDREVENE